MISVITKILNKNLLYRKKKKKKKKKKKARPAYMQRLRISVSDGTDGEDNENNSSSNEPGDDNDSAQSSEDNDNSDKDTTILIPTHVNTPDYEDIRALKWGREHCLRFFPSIKRPLHIRSNK